MAEIWKPIPGYEGYYEASNTGRYRSVDREVTRSDGIVIHIKGRELKFHKGLDNYAIIDLTRDGRTHSVLAHRIFAQLFLPDFDPALTVNHKDDDKFNNAVDNLEMMTIQENIHHFRTSPVFEDARKHISEVSSALHKGRKRSSESIRKWRESYKVYVKEHGGTRKGAVVDTNTRKKISFAQGTHVHCIETDQYFTSYKWAAQFFDVDVTTMISWCEQGRDRVSYISTQKYADLHFETTDESDLSKYVY